MKRFLLCLSLVSCGGEEIVYNTVSWDPAVCGESFGTCMSGMSGIEDAWQVHRQLLTCEYKWRACNQGQTLARKPECEDIEYNCLAEAGFERDERKAQIKAGECWKGYDFCANSRAMNRDDGETRSE